MLSINLKIDTLLFTLSLAFFATSYFQTDAMAQATEQVAQPRSASAASGTYDLAVPSQQPRRITALRVTNISAGSRLTIVSDVPLDDYTAYHETDRFYVVIPRAEISVTRETINGQGFTSAEFEQHGDSVLLRFHLQVGETARASRTFN